MKTSIYNKCTEIDKKYRTSLNTIHILQLSMLLTAFLLFNSCKENSTIADDLNNIIDYGQFSAEVTGNENQSFSGLALFAVQIIDEPVGNIFVLSMNSLNTNLIYGIGATMSSIGRPPAGTYTLEGITTNQTGQFTVFNESNSELAVYHSTAGELKILSSASDRLEGEITFTAQKTGSIEQVEVVAQFNASCQQADFLSCD